MLDQRSSMGTLVSGTPFGVNHRSDLTMIGKGKLIQPSPLRKLLLGQQVSGQPRLQNSDDIMRQTQEIQR